MNVCHPNLFLVVLCMKVDDMIVNVELHFTRALYSVLWDVGLNIPSSETTTSTRRNPSKLSSSSLGLFKCAVANLKWNCCVFYFCKLCV